MFLSFLIKESFTRILNVCEQLFFAKVCFLPLRVRVVDYVCFFDFVVRVLKALDLHQSHHLVPAHLCF